MKQLEFDTLKHPAACKFLEEGALLFGSEVVFERLKSLLRQFGVIDRLRAMEREAHRFRMKAEECLLNEALEKIKESPCLFYPAEESEEFE